MSRHTIVLLQSNSNPASRQYSDFDTEEKAMDGVCQIFEAKLKADNPHQKKITYDAQKGAYVPRNKQWIKDRVFAHLQKQAGGS